MKKDQRFTGASFHVVEPDTVDLEESTGRGVVQLRLLRPVTVEKRTRRQGSYSNCGGNRIRDGPPRRCDVALQTWGSEAGLHAQLGS